MGTASRFASSPKSRLLPSRLLLAFCIGVFALHGAAAADPPKGLTTQKIAEGLYLIQGPGGNIALQTGKDAVFLVDDQVAPMTPQLQAELVKVTNKPVRFVLNTHWHEDHTGGNEKMGAGGAVIVAHDNVRKRLSTPQVVEMFHRSIPPAQPGALPVITFADSVSFHLNDDDIDVFHVEAAHTDGDSIVWFHREDVIHMGDTFVTNGYPFIDISSGGAINGFIHAADRVLAVAKATTKIIPGHGDLATASQLKTYRDMLVTIRDRIQKGMAAGKSLTDIQATKPTAEFDAQKSAGFIKPAQFVETIYNTLPHKR
jgi:glyoxylase-like metal-dependent hydrolase (beta-lactamase superfamily II)